MISSVGSTSSIGPTSEPLGGREPFAIGVLMAVVDDPDVEVGLGRQAGDGLPDVPCPDDDQPDTRPVRQVARSHREPMGLGRSVGRNDPPGESRRGSPASGQLARGRPSPSNKKRVPAGGAGGLPGVDDDRFGESCAFLDHLVERAEIARAARCPAPAA